MSSPRVDLRSDTVTRSTLAMGQGVPAIGLYRPRFATRLDVDAAGIDLAIAAIGNFLHA